LSEHEDRVQKPTRLYAYVALVASLGLAAVLSAVWVVHPGKAIAFAGAFGVSEYLRSNLRDNVKASLSNLVVLVAVLDGGWALAIVATLGALPFFLHQVSEERWLRIGFNSGQLAVSAAVAAGAYTGATALVSASFPHPSAIAAIALASIVYVLVNHVLVGVVVALASGEPLRSALSSVLQVGWLQAPYVGIAILAAALLRAGGVGPALLVLLALPVMIARSGLVAFQKTDEAYDRLVRSFVTAIEVKDLYTRGHSERVSELSVHVAEELGIPYDERRLTGYAALLHDVGKIGVPLCIINKPGPLDDDEFAAIRRHPEIGAEILRDIDFLAPALDIVRYHHERLDGHGYPHGVGEEELGNLVRIVTAVDAFDAMTSTRSYRRALGVEEALAELRRCVGTQFDGRVVEALANVVERLDWQPTVEFASAAELHGQTIPVGTAVERLDVEAGP
jgi:putative nucleotidyltransferase with HDIG domain